MVNFKSKTLLYWIIICFILATCSAVTVSAISTDNLSFFEMNSTEVNQNSGTSNPSIINNQIHFQSKKLTSSKQEKLLPVTSPDGNMVAFAYNLFASSNQDPKIGFVDIKSGETIDIPIIDHLATSWLKVGWFDNKRFGVVGQINPSLEVIEIVNIESKKIENTYYGLGFTWDDKHNRLLFNVPQPHFGEGEKGKNKIVDDLGNIYYESPIDVVIYGGPNIDKTGQNIAFFEGNMTTNDIFLVTATKSNNKGSVSNIKKSIWEHDIGKIEWKDHKSIKINGRYSILEYDLNQQALLTRTDTPEKIELDLKFQEKNN
ncbi:hypothetical protein [Marinicrinis sediminis]|uniref:SH3 domain-containing protein n=1 Tax=Marinicrinis sediminis TaxID=1652465 RepID=A0ABW5R7B1_9BACL